MEVHNYLGNGFLEPVYQEAVQLELHDCQIPYEREKKIEIYYKNQLLEKYYVADFICYNNIILELKAVSKLLPEHKGQVLNYLKATNKKLALLINFGADKLEFVRVIR